MQKKFFEVAEHVFSVEACDEVLSQIGNYSPFLVKPPRDCVFSLTVVAGENPPDYVEDARQEEEGQSIVCGKTAGGLPAFDFCLRNVSTGLLVCSKNFSEARLFLSQNRVLDKFSLDNSLMVLYALATAKLGTVLFHAAAVTFENRGYLFLGKSGTGKSTHARLWLRHVEGSDLLNDDNPVVRFFETEDGKRFAKVYGSPWSGKTPCYKNASATVGGIVLLSQAPFNKISPLQGVAAYAALVPCISGMRWEKEVADGLHCTENALAANVPVWSLECLPDEAAARLCRGTIA